MDTTYSVADLARRISGALSRAFGEEVWVEGEIRDLRRHGSHAYFTLVDPDEPDAVLPVSLFSRDRDAVNRVLRRSGAVRMTDGVHVRIRGQVTFQTSRSAVRLRMTWIDTDYTLGRLAAGRRELLRRLERAGLLDRNATLDVPAIPLRVGLVTSAGSAAHGDFVAELERSGFGFTVGVVDVRVQGRHGPGDVVAALDRLAGWRPDVVTVVRGGGPQTDLAVFDTAEVAEAVATAPFPVLVGIGHQIDSTVVDRVAARSYKTPTACAAAVVELVAAVDARITTARRRLAGAAAQTLRSGERALASGTRRLAIAGRHRLREASVLAGRHRTDLARESQRTVAAAGGRLDRSTTALVAVARRRVEGADSSMGDARTRLDREATRRVADAERRLDTLAALVRANEPERMLARGWTITRDGDGRLLHTAGVAAGDLLSTTTAVGTVHSRVTPPVPGPDGRVDDPAGHGGDRGGS